MQADGPDGPQHSKGGPYGPCWLLQEAEYQQLSVMGLLFCLGFTSSIHLPTYVPQIGDACMAKMLSGQDVMWRQSLQLLPPEQIFQVHLSRVGVPAAAAFHWLLRPVTSLGKGGRVDLAQTQLLYPCSVSSLSHCHLAKMCKRPEKM